MPTQLYDGFGNPITAYTQSEVDELVRTAVVQKTLDLEKRIQELIPIARKPTTVKADKAKQ